MGVTELGKEVAKSFALKGIDAAMSNVNNFIIDQTIMNTITNKILVFIKQQLKNLMNSISKEMRIMMNTALSLCKNFTFTQKLGKLKESIPKIKSKIQICDSNIRNNLNLYETFISKAALCHFDKDFGSVMTEIKQTPGKEEGIFEMKGIFEEVISNSEAKNLICSNLGDVLSL